MERLRQAIELSQQERATNILYPSSFSSRKIEPPIDQIVYSQTQACPVAEHVLKSNRVLTAEVESETTMAYKMLRTQVLQRLMAKGWNTLMVTSPGPGQGKTLTAINLAISLAREMHHTVLLADFDLRKPGVHKYFGLSPTYGIGDYLLKGTPLPEILINPGIERFVILPGREPLYNSSEMLGSLKVRQLVHEMKTRYPSRIILFDLPPLLSTDDSLAFSPYVDAALMIVEDSKTEKEDLQRAIGLLQSTPVIGTVLNRSNEATYFIKRT
jgi:protein-tyrosine kinase